MHKHFLFSLIITLIGLLIACAPVYNTDYDFTPPKSDVAKMCTAHCVQSKNACEQNCRFATDNCRLRAQQSAIYEFNQYKEEQNRLGFTINKSTKDFDRSSSCNQSCNCESTYRSCYSSCGGEVSEKKVCVAFCGNH